ncbi:MAG: hypothetical protein PHX08_21230, partial [Lachnospiraceae bacterium]|nr:hypothetical protein [Lachnospiraceae bacterium]
MELEKKNEEIMLNEVQEADTENEMVTEDEIVTEDDDIAVTPKKKKKKLPGWFIVVIIAIIVAIVILASVLSKNKSGSTGTKLTVTTVETSDVKEVLNTSGIIKSENEKVVYSPVNATVSQFAAKIGESVKKGTMLVVFDTKDLEKNNQQSQLNELSTKYANQSTYEQTNRSIAKAAEAASTAEKQAVDQYNAVVNQYNEIANTVPGLQNAANAEAASNSALSNPIQTQINTLAGQIEAKTQELITTNA